MENKANTCTPCHHLCCLISQYSTPPQPDTTTTSAMVHQILYENQRASNPPYTQPAQVLSLRLLGFKGPCSFLLPSVHDNEYLLLSPYSVSIYTLNISPHSSPSLDFRDCIHLGAKSRREKNIVGVQTHHLNCHAMKE